jgi:Bacterial Ig domain/Right handed beta helix region
VQEARSRWKRGVTWALIFMIAVATPALAGGNKRSSHVNPGRGDANANCNKTKTCEVAPPDTEPPTETIDHPSNGAKVSGTIKVMGAATDNVGVDTVDVAVDGGAFAVATGTASWARSIDTTTLSNATHRITARATDAAGNTSSVQISIDVANPVERDTDTDPTGSTGGGSTTPTTPTTPTDPPTGCDKKLDGPGNIQAALTGLQIGQTLCLSGTFTTSIPIKPKNGQKIVGPASIVGQGMSPLQDVFQTKPAEGVTYKDLDVSSGGRRGIGCWLGTTILGGRLHDNGQNGTGCDLEGRTTHVLIDGTEVDHNGRNPDTLGCCAGGVKWFHANGVTIRNSNVHDNIGNGVWCDAQCGDFTVENNTIVRNSRKGVFYEKGGASDGSFLGRTWAVYEGMATIVNNIIRDNDTEGVPQAHAGVSLYASKNAYIAHNIFGGNGRAVIAREDEERLVDDKHGWHLSNIVIENNTLNGDEILGCASEGVRC